MFTHPVPLTMETHNDIRVKCQIPREILKFIKYLHEIWEYAKYPIEIVKRQSICPVLRLFCYFDDVIVKCSTLMLLLFRFDPLTKSNKN
jgi:hypothetical protein